jgi:hypothetical protein
VQLCQRYFQVCTSGASFAAIGNGTTGLQQVGVPLCTAMRTTPTLSASVWYAAGSTFFISSSVTATVAAYAANGNILRVSVNGFTGLTDNAVYQAAAASTLTLSAEL